MQLMAWVLLRWAFSFRVKLLTDSLYCMLVFVTVLTCCFQVPMLLPCLPTGAQLLGFAMPQPCGVYPWQAYVSWWWSVAHDRTALSGCSFHCAKKGGASCYPFSCSLAIPSKSWGIQLGGIGRVTNPSPFPTWWGGVFFSRLCSTQWHGKLQICGGC